ncbi:wall-associated receptor kinase-like protein [Pseudocercospora fijiensis CIRAD86]|uniref:Wall-associated receptor kinase-like protein n=1 Tax=Pseudocercospora fijiensis (strain CIRAD86) TaxID=383855 RepID=N1QC12_PSEFD|nr:wall-associated receptor kinase-like protein [Pseudocercospora fijiensis CIRAD86]EME89786.1 wall-associated receptor kinase-like protein [Pseudocercospora fijiensis CIRAD86]
MKFSESIALLVLSAASTYAQGFGGYYGGNPYSGSDGSDGGNDDGDSGFGRADFGGFGGFELSTYRTKLIAHAVLATLAFGFFFPVGGIMIRLASFRGLWWIHGLFQIFAYILYIAAFALGVYMVTQSPIDDMLHNVHPIIGIILLVLIFFQPILGFLHHLMFKKYSRRTFWSYGHLWLGRIVITLGIINGGLGLRFARQFPLAPPSNGAIIGYSVAAGFMWLLYVISVVIGERRRSSVKQVAPPTYKEASETGSARSKRSRQEYA